MVTFRKNRFSHQFLFYFCLSGQDESVTGRETEKIRPESYPICLGPGEEEVVS